MYNVLLVDDEAIIRKGLKNIINWQNYNCRVCAEASDGYEGLEMVEKHRPDIIFADIRMPAMDGLEMIGQISEDGYAPKVIILTGYSDFAYAKEAIALGVYDFLLKPTKLDEIKLTIAKVAAELDREKKRASEISNMYSRYNEYIPKLQEKLLYEVLTGITKKSDDIKEQALDIGLEVDENYLSIVSLAEKNDEVTIEMIGALNTFVDMVCERHTSRRIIIDESRFAVMINANITNEDDMYIQLMDIKDSVYNMLGIRLNLAISSIERGILGLNASYNECRIEMNNEIIADNVSDNMGLSQSCREKKLISFANVRKYILDNIAYGEEKAKKKMMDYILDIVCDDGNAKEQMMDFADELKSMIPECDHAINSDSVLTLKDDIKHLAITLSRYTEEQTSKQTKLIVQHTKEYLEENYYRHVTLAEVSKAVYVSTYYISRVFSKETGMTITEYVNQVRIEQACSLLKDVKLKVYQIGDMVGIADAHYFSRLFKKHIGMSPSEYRNIQV